MDGENNGKPYQNGWFGGSTIFGNTHIAPENGWLEDDPFLLGFGLFSGVFAVSFREGKTSGCLGYISGMI